MSFINVSYAALSRRRSLSISVSYIDCEGVKPDFTTANESSHQRSEVWKNTALCYWNDVHWNLCQRARKRDATTKRQEWKLWWAIEENCHNLRRYMLHMSTYLQQCRNNIQLSALFGLHPCDLAEPVSLPTHRHFIVSTRKWQRFTFRQREWSYHAWQ